MVTSSNLFPPTPISAAQLSGNPLLLLRKAVLDTTFGSNFQDCPVLVLMRDGRTAPHTLLSSPCFPIPAGIASRADARPDKMALEQQPELWSQFPTRGRQRTEQQRAEAEHGTAALLRQPEQSMVKNVSLDRSGGSWTESMPSRN